MKAARLPVEAHLRHQAQWFRTAQVRGLANGSLEKRKENTSQNQHDDFGLCGICMDLYGYIYMYIIYNYIYICGFKRHEQGSQFAPRKTINKNGAYGQTRSWSDTQRFCFFEGNFPPFQQLKRIDQFSAVSWVMAVPQIIQAIRPFGGFHSHGGTPK